MKRQRGQELPLASMLKKRRATYSSPPSYIPQSRLALPEVPIPHYAYTELDFPEEYQTIAETLDFAIPERIKKIRDQLDEVLRIVVGSNPCDDKNEFGYELNYGQRLIVMETISIAITCMLKPVDKACYGKYLMDYFKVVRLAHNIFLIAQRGYGKSMIERMIIAAFGMAIPGYHIDMTGAKQSRNIENFEGMVEMLENHPRGKYVLFFCFL